MKRFVTILAITCSVAAAGCGGGQAHDAPTPIIPAAGQPIPLATPGLAIDTAKTYHAVFRTEKGDFTIELFAEDAPVTVNNFVFLARSGYYDGVTFHRVLEDFMAQGGDPTGTGGGSPGYRIPDEISDRLHDGPGVLSMAKAPAPDTGGSQFFITFRATPHLDGIHSVFGQVVEGMDVVHSISLRDPVPGAPAGDVIHTIDIVEEG